MVDAVSWKGNKFEWLGVVTLLAIFGVLATVAVVQKGVSFDEAEELAVGYDVWVRHDFRMESGNGDLVKRWATLPFLISRPKLPGTNNPAWKQGQPYEFGTSFFFGSGNRPASLLRQARFIHLVLGLALGLLVYLCSRELFGRTGGFVSLAAFVLSPSMLAFAALVSTEVSICLTLLGSTWCIWRLLHRVTWGWLIGSLVMCGLLVLAKPSALVIVPVTGVLLIVRLVGGRPLNWEIGRRCVVRAAGRQAALFAGLAVLHAAAAWGAIWAHYDFRYEASPAPSDPTVVFRPLARVDPVGTVPSAFIAWSKRTHFLPQGMLFETERLLGRDEHRAGFLNGQWRVGGWWYFFPLAMGMKFPPAVLLLGGLAGFAGWRLRRQKTEGATPSRLYAAAPFVTLAAVYMGVAMTQEINIGLRHVLPVFPPIYVLVGAAGWCWSSLPRWGRGVVLALFGWMAVEVIAICPDYLAYFSPVVGGPSQGYRHLVDSSLDWGMDLPGLKRWLDRNNSVGEPTFLAYFGTDDPAAYGIKATRLPGFFEVPRAPYPLTPGIYAISASLLQSVYTRPFGPWCAEYERRYQARLAQVTRIEKARTDPAVRAALLAEHPAVYWDNQYAEYELLRFARLCAWLRHHQKPDAEVGYSILIWRLGTVALTDALFGPPPELSAVQVD